MPDDKIYDNYQKDYYYYINAEIMIELGFKVASKYNINNGLYGPLTEELSIINSKYDVDIYNFDETKHKNK